MRIVTGIGAFGFAWLALIPVALLAYTFDSGCSAPGCGTALPVEVVLVALYGAIMLTVGATMLLLADYTVRARPRSLALVPVALRACAVAVGLTLFFFVCLFSAIAGVVVAVIVVGTWRLLRPHNPPAQDPEMVAMGAEVRRRSGPPPHDPNLN